MGEGAYLESAAEAENAVIGLLGRETLDGLENDVGLLGDEVIGSVTHELLELMSSWLSGGGSEANWG